jgi:3-hydroxymyristoyl/3-hydroxydecanoyl-(acyl carrier protein) dehydratases
MSEKILIQGEDLLTLIPQRPPMVMIDVFYGFKEDRSYTGLRINRDNLFFDRDHLSEAGLIEHMAQSAAARAGYEFQIQQKEVPLGFIASVDKLKISGLPLEGDELYTEIKQTGQVGDVTLIWAQTKGRAGVMAECGMKIFLKKE